MHMEGRGISGLVAEYIVAIDVTRARFPADAFALVDCASKNRATITHTSLRLAMSAQMMINDDFRMFL